MGGFLLGSPLCAQLDAYLLMILVIGASGVGITSVYACVVCASSPGSSFYPVARASLPCPSTVSHHSALS